MAYRAELKKSTREGKKYMAVFYDRNGEKLKTVHFGAEGYEDFTTHGDIERRANYIRRHQTREATLWRTDPMAPATLSRFVLWNKPSLQASWRDYLARFRLKG